MGAAGYFAGSGEPKRVRPDDVQRDCFRSPGADAGFFRLGPQDFHHSIEVLDHPGLTVSERRATLADWASDVHAVENAPWLRQLENGARIAVSEILSALRSLDDRPPAAAVRRHHGFATMR
jgi:hypothetical protein